MADIFDQVSAPTKQDIFDQVSAIDFSKLKSTTQGLPSQAPVDLTVDPALARRGDANTFNVQDPYQQTRDIAKQRAVDIVNKSPLEGIGISPQGIQTGANKVLNALPQGIQPAAKVLAAPGVAVDKTLAGIVDFITSPKGAAQTGLAALPPARIPMAIKFFQDMAIGGSQSASDAIDAYKKGDLQGTADAVAATLANFGGAAMLGIHTAGAELPKPAQKPLGTIGDVFDKLSEAQKAKLPTAQGNREGAASQPLPTPEKVSPTAGASETVGTEAPTVTVKGEQNTPIVKPIGMGGAALGELEGTGQGREVGGISAKVKAAREHAEMSQSPEPGRGIAPEDSVERGKDLIARGVDPDSVLSNFEASKRFSADDVAVVRSRLQELQRNTNKTEEKYGTDTDEFRAASKAESDFAARAQPMLTEWAKAGHSMQGAVDIDLGTFMGFKRAHEDAGGHEFTPQQENQARGQAKRISSGEKDVENVSAKVSERIKQLETELTPEEKRLQQQHEDESKLTDEERRLQDQFEHDSKSADDELESAQKKEDAAKVQEEAARKAQEAADKTVREAAARAAEQENKDRSAQQKLATKEQRVQMTAAEKAKAAADKTVRLAAARKAAAESKERSRIASVQRQAAEAARKAAEKRVADINKFHRNAATKAAKKEVKNNILKANRVKWVWHNAKKYVGDGLNNFDDLVNKLGIDLGLTKKEVREALSKDQQLKAATDEMYRKRYELGRVKNQAKQWLRQQRNPGWLNFIQRVPKIFFIDKIFGHGTVGMITHAGLNVFNPTAWKTYWPAFFQQYKLLGSSKYHEQAMEDLIRDPNWTLAQRAGLINDPRKFQEDYSNAFSGNFHKLGLGGNRGFDALKLFRQARFNQIWNDLPKTLKTTEMAQLIADDINHATGVVKMPFREWTGWAWFAPKLEASRWAWMVGDPAKAAAIFKEWKTATPEQKQFAISQLKQKAYIAGAYITLLAANQGLLKATGSNQSINFTKPNRSDFLAFKADGHDIGIVSPMLGMVRLFANLAHDALGKRDKVKQLSSRWDEIGSSVGSYARGKLSPFSSFAADVASQADFSGRPLPFSKDKVPAYLRKEGVKTPYTYGEYAETKFAPIPAEEAIREVWHDQGMSENDIRVWLSALTTAAVVGGTGVRVSPDIHEGK